MVGHLAVGIWRKPAFGAVAFSKAASGWEATVTLGQVPTAPEKIGRLLGGLDTNQSLPPGWTRRDNLQGGT